MIYSKRAKTKQKHYSLLITAGKYHSVEDACVCVLVLKNDKQGRGRESWEKNWKDRQEKKQNVTDDICENANVADGWRFHWQAGRLLTAGAQRHQRGHSQRESATFLIITTTEYH